MTLAGGKAYEIVKINEDGWWFAIDTETNAEGWAPSNYLQAEEVCKPSEDEVSILYMYKCVTMYLYNLFDTQRFINIRKKILFM